MYIEFFFSSPHIIHFGRKMLLSCSRLKNPTCTESEWQQLWFSACRIEEQLPSPPVPRAPINQQSANLASNPDSKLKPLSNLEILTRYIFIYLTVFETHRKSQITAFTKGENWFTFQQEKKNNSVCGVTELGIWLPKVEGVRSQWTRTFCLIFSSTWI